MPPLPQRVNSIATSVIAAIAIASAKVPLSIVNPGQVRHFAKATGQLAKTDAIDARVLARFG